MAKTVVIGLDGASWNVLMPFIDKGSLPNIKRIIEEGAWGFLESCYPPSTFPAWKCYSIGRNPAKIGVFNWVNVSFKQKRIRLNFSTNFEGKEIWDYLNEGGFSTGIINMPSTYPPKAVNGFMVSGFVPSMGCDITYPKEFQKELEKFNYQATGIEEFLEKDKQSLFKEMKKFVKSRFALARSQIENVDFLHLTIFYIDSIQHRYWGDDIVEEIWKEIDKELGFFLDGKINFVVFSDHGFRKNVSTFFINDWLEKEGFLVLKPTKREMVKRIAKKALGKKFLGFIGGEQMQEYLDWNRTIAFGDDFGLLYFNTTASWKEREEVLEELEKLVHPVLKKRIFKRFIRKDKIYLGKFIIEDAPDYFLEANEGFHVKGGLMHKRLFTQKPTWIATHSQNGIVAFFGDRFKAKKITGAKIYDLAPTILKTFDNKGEGFDGEPLDVFKKPVYDISG